MKKILVIEDNRDILENTAELLELSNYDVITAANGKEGIEKALSHLPDLIICDIMMPEVDGYGVLHMVQRNEQLKATPFIFLSAKAEQGEIRKGMQQGADDYIPKPFDTTDLLNAVERRLKKAEETHQQIALRVEETNQQLSVTNHEKALAEFVEGRSFDWYKKKQIIHKEGNHPAYLYYLQTGKVKVFKTDEEGREWMVGLHQEGDFFGYIPLLDGTVYQVSAEAIEDSEVASIPKKEFEELIYNYTDVAKKFIQLLTSNVDEKEQQLLNVVYHSLRKKVAEALLTIQNKFQKNRQKSFAISISRENLASIAGTATESLIRTLTDFKNERLIDIENGSVIILNELKLKNLVN